MVIDTMVFAYALIRVEDYCEQAIVAIETAEQIIVPDSLFAELGNVGRVCKPCLKGNKIDFLEKI